MKKYSYSKEERAFIEGNCIPFSTYQFIDNHVETLAISAGFVDLFNLDNLDEAYRIMRNDMYLDAHPDDISRIADAAERFAFSDEPYDILFRNMNRGEYRVIRAKGEHMYTPSGERIAVVWYTDEGPYVADPEGGDDPFAYSLSRVIRDNSRNYNEKFDHLTGLPQMSYFFELAVAGREEIEKAGGLAAMLFFDLSGMKIYNQKYGFGEGNILLKKIARVLVRHFGSNNCSRFNGDHFAVYTSQSDLEQRLQVVLAELEVVNGSNSLPVRIGVYRAMDGQNDPSTACDRAKIACDSSRNSYISSINYFDDEMLHKEEMRQYVISNLEKAIKEGWIQVYYQPIIRATNGLVSDEEALSRWIDPERGTIMPGDFIPILEDTGLAYKLDLFVLDNVIEKMKIQDREGFFVVPQSLNLSRTDFYACDIVEEIKKRIDDAGVDHSRLTIEITESVVGSDVEYMKEQIERFQALGFAVWMDDYGSGYSSPELLQAIHFDTLKFDMQYVQSFENGDENKIILTELIKMAISLGIETVVEGVETKEQVDFLKDIGCAKLQGYYYSMPLSHEKLVEISKGEPLFGCENPAETEYYSIIGKISLYDMTVTQDDAEGGFLKNYFNALPMAIMEMNDTDLWIVRANQTYKEFFSKSFDGADANADRTKDVGELQEGRGSAFIKALQQCAKDGKRALLDERTPDGGMMHVFIRRVAINPVTGVVAFAVVLFGVENSKDANNLSYTYVAQTLASDYISLYYVDLDTDQFVEYGSTNAYDDLVIERHGENFFAQCHSDSILHIFDEDKEGFYESFFKENVMDILNQKGVYTLTFRIVKKDEPIYVHLKAVKIKAKGNFAIIGISDIDAQKKQQESFERIKEEQIAYSRISALSGNYIIIFTVDPATGEYTTYTVEHSKHDPGMPEQGDEFLHTFRRASRNMIYLEDMERVLNELTMDNILAQIRQYGIFSITYRDLHSGEPRYVNLRVALVEEKNGKRLLFGISDVNEQIKREQDAAAKLAAARNEVNRDALTGVKNKHAYIDVEAQINSMIEENNAPDFAVVVMDINSLKQINDTKGHQAGDELIKKGCDIICKIFRHSPVFRIGGDEFAVIAQGGDFKNINKLMELLDESNKNNLKDGDVVIAGGVAKFCNERSVADVFAKADELMYRNKHQLKSG